MPLSIPYKWTQTESAITITGHLLAGKFIPTSPPSIIHTNQFLQFNVPPSILTIPTYAPIQDVKFTEVTPMTFRMEITKRNSELWPQLVQNLTKEEEKVVVKVALEEWEENQRQKNQQLTKEKELAIKETRERQWEITSQQRLAIEKIKQNERDEAASDLQEWKSRVQAEESVSNSKKNSLPEVRTAQKILLNFTAPNEKFPSLPARETPEQVVPQANTLVDAQGETAIALKEKADQQAKLGNAVGAIELYSQAIALADRQLKANEKHLETLQTYIRTSAKTDENSMNLPIFGLLYTLHSNRSNGRFALARKPYTTEITVNNVNQVLSPSALFKSYQYSIGCLKDCNNAMRYLALDQKLRSNNDEILQEQIRIEMKIRRRAAQIYEWFGYHKEAKHEWQRLAEMWNSNSAKHPQADMGTTPILTTNNENTNPNVQEQKYPELNVKNDEKLREETEFLSSRIQFCDNAMELIRLRKLEELKASGASSIAAKAFDKGILSYTSGLQIAPSSALHNNRSVCYLHQHKWLKSIEDCSWAVHFARIEARNVSIAEESNELDTMTESSFIPLDSSIRGRLARIHARRAFGLAKLQLYSASHTDYSVAASLCTEYGVDGDVAFSERSYSNQAKIIYSHLQANQMIRKGQKLITENQFSAAEDEFKKTIGFIANSVKDIESSNLQTDILKQAGVMHEAVVVKMRRSQWSEARTQAAYAYQLLVQWNDQNNELYSGSRENILVHPTHTQTSEIPNQNANFTIGQLRLKNLLCIKIGTCLAYEGDLAKAGQWYKEGILGMKSHLESEPSSIVQGQLEVVQSDYDQIEALLSKLQGN